jgi:hypothetical protein
MNVRVILIQAIFCLGWSHELSCTGLTDPRLSALALFPRMHIVGQIDCQILLDLDLHSGKRDVRGDRSSGECMDNAGCLLISTEKKVD